MITFLLACLLTIQQPPSATIHIHAPGKKAITLALPVKGTNYWVNRKTFPLNKKGMATIKVSADNCGLILVDTDKSPIRLITSPGDNIDLSLDKVVTYAGDNAEGHQYYNTLIRYSIMDVNNPYKNDTIAADIEQQVHTLRDQELARVDSLPVSPAWATFARLDIRYYYAASLADAMAYKFWMSRNNFKKEYAAAWEKSFREMPLDDTAAIVTENFKYYAETYYRVYKRAYLQEKATPNLLGNYEMINKYFNGKTKAYLTAYYLADHLLQKMYEPELAVIYQQFMTEFPGNAYLPLLQPGVDEVIAFQQASMQEPSDAYTFLSPGINSLDTLLQTLKGQAYYVDIWATWCVPCKAEFRYKTPFLEDKHIKRLYLSIDSPDRDTAWKDMIKYYKLRGTHLRTTQSLFNDLNKRINLTTIPRYLLIDKEGKITHANAARPSNANALRRQI